ncbi:MAG: hypothetical protein GWQ05_28005 [Verrucomicrobiaceae bacterium]|nr:hypothetical protein [Verrucomicrobiaceae bacterium]
MLPRLFVVTACFLTSFAGPLSATPTLPPEEAEHFRRQLPKLYKKLSEQKQVHIAFVGDPLWLNDDDAVPQNLVSTYLRHLEEAFYYVGGVHRLYEFSHLEEKRPKITYECRPTDVADPGIFQLIQYVSTLGLLNEPDLLVVCAGPGDLSAGLDITTILRGYDQLRAMAVDGGSEFLVLGPRAFAFNGEGALDLRMETSGESVAIASWAARNGIPYLDPNPNVFPRSVLFADDAEPQAIWNSFLREAVDWIQGQARKSEIAPRRQQAVGTALYERLVTAPPVNRYNIVTEHEDQDVIVKMERLSKFKYGGLLVPSLSNQRDGVRFQSTDTTLSFRLDRPEDMGLSYRGRLPFTVLVIDDRRVSWIPVDAMLANVGLEWVDHAHADNDATVPVKARVYRYAGAPDNVPYEMTFRNEKTSGTVRFSGDFPGIIDWAVTLPDEARTVREILVIRLGNNGSLGHYERQLDAIRQFPLNKPVPLQLVGGAVAKPDAEKEVDPLSVGDPEALLTVEASKEDIFVHVDLKNVDIVSTDGSPGLQADLTLDARSYGKRQTLGYAGVLFLSAGPEDGPATVSPFAKRAHFGNGYARRPKVLGRQARLSTRPNGTRRLTIQMTRAYFYKHKWALANHNSQLGIGLSLAVTQPGDAQPLRYVLQETPRFPNNAEDLAVIELSEKGSNRWCVKWSPLVKRNDVF